MYFTHKIKNKQSKLSIDLQSSGTLQYLGLIGKLKNMIEHCEAIVEFCSVKLILIYGKKEKSNKKSDSCSGSR